MDGSNTSFLLGPVLFTGAFAVSFREGILTNLMESITSGSRRMGYLRTCPSWKITIFHSRCIFIRGCLHMVRLVIGGVSWGLPSWLTKKHIRWDVGGLTVTSCVLGRHTRNEPASQAVFQMDGCLVISNQPFRRYVLCTALESNKQLLTLWLFQVPGVKIWEPSFKVRTKKSPENFRRLNELDIVVSSDRPRKLTLEV